MICDVKRSGELTVLASHVWTTEKHLLCNLLSLLIKIASNEGLSAVRRHSNRLNFYSCINFILNCQVIETESSDLWQHFARSLGLALFAFVDYFLIEKYSFMTHN